MMRTASGNCYVSLGAPDSADFAFTKCDAEGTFEFKGIPQGNMRSPYSISGTTCWSMAFRRRSRSPAATIGDRAAAGDSRHAVAHESLRPHLPRSERRQCFAGRRAGPAAGAVQHPVPRRQLHGVQQHRSRGQRRLQRSLPVPQLAGRRYRQRALQADGRACRVRRRRPGRRHAGRRRFQHRGRPCEYHRVAKSAPSRGPAHSRRKYCKSADCDTGTFDPGTGSTPGSTGRIDPGWVPSEGWQGLLGQNSFAEFAMRQFEKNENGGIKGT